MMKKIVVIFSFLLYGFCALSQSISKYIVTDQFGYRPGDRKIAVIRDPQTGFDAAESFTPGNSYVLVDATNDEVVFSDAPTIWNNGQEDTTSGDKAWWFDFSSFSDEGSYYVLDQDKNVKSYTFEIAPDIYDNVLKHAVRTFYYQRVGYAKELPYAEVGWTDGASHIGPLQDKNSRPYNDKNNAAKEKDVSGGWYDAGDYNKYTIWTANYIYEMLQAYEENPYAWTDDYDLPQSGNGIPDLIDEAKWGMDHLLKLQNSDGSVIAIVSVDHASPPSAATKPSIYGAVNTSSTLAAAGAYAYSAKVFAKFGEYAYADLLKTAAKNAYSWAEANPNVLWKNNDNASGTAGVGSGQQEVNDYERMGYKMRASAHLYEITEEEKYKTHFEANYTKFNMFDWYYSYPYEIREQEILLYYTSIKGISSNVKDAILDRYAHTIANNAINIKAYDQKIDPYNSYIDSYVWGSNGIKPSRVVCLWVLFYTIPILPEMKI
jgi:endoglucanase